MSSIMNMKMCRQQQRGFFLYLFLFSMVIFLAKCSQGLGESVGTKLELIHRHHLQPMTKLERLRQLLHSDTIRQRSISESLRLKKIRNTTGRRQVLENPNATYYHPDCSNSSRRDKSGCVSGKMTMNSGADFGTGQYFVSFSVGSPAQRFVLIADTGSDLTWMNCKYRCHGAQCRKKTRKRRVFRADHSSSFDTVPCSSRMCKIELASLFSLTRCPSPHTPCAYDYRYLDGSAALGIFANETVTFGLTNGTKGRIHNVLVGCSESSTGQSFQEADGVMGLGYSNYSFALKAAEKFGGKFSYCLVDHLSPQNVSSYLIFGSHKTEYSITTHYRMRQTELVLGVVNPFYAVNIKGISLGSIMLKIPAEVWNVNGGGGVILDSGSSLTFLTQPAYQPVMAALKLSLINFTTLNLDIPQLEFCVNSTGFDESLVPRLVFHFADGARFEPPVKSYVIDVAPGVKCLGFVRSTWPGASVIGNIMQQNHIWEFDLANNRLSFGSSSCT
ncbi:aspartic proteinase NANA, chloroplast-like [Olea europaea var. sylvestris]|uniref:aspartic proteinase NANA, chloroplast-like n=1 Tax=Olea europaea var. sylvestris TaxID=158386 RepID=UPI000C1D673A|nr:aspartic proteinase NANA, chloroplast-like [Olea europaea var. sylvestris]